MMGISFNHYQSEALVACLLISIIWAGMLFFGARGVERARLTPGSGQLWVAALLLAILPSLLAPALAGLGVSLRKSEPQQMFVAEVSALPAAIDTKTFIEQRAEKPAISFTREQLTGGAALIYVYGAALALFIWAMRHAGFAFAAARARVINNKRLSERVDDWAFDLGVRTPALKRSRDVSSVCVHGVIRPTILIPQDIDITVAEDDLVIMCAHELAHVRRGDTRLFTATALARALFWFNPLVALIAARVEQAAEEGADALVIDAGVDRRQYAHCFVEGLKFAAMKLGAQPALSFTPADRRSRRRRLDAILSDAPASARRTPLAARALLAAAAFSGGLIAIGQAAFAVDPDSASERKGDSDDIVIASMLKNDGEASADKPVILSMPVKGDVTLGYQQNFSDLTDGHKKAHQGVDIKAPKGTPVKAAGAGVVVDATSLYENQPNWGKVVVIDHGHGLVTRYAHLDSYAVKRGDIVKSGEIIARVGETGKVTGPHLHFETLKNGARIDPVRTVSASEASKLKRTPKIAPIAPATPVEPVIAPTTNAAPEPVIAPDPAAAPAPEPVISGADFDGGSFVFANGDTLADHMSADLEHRLLGDGLDGAVYNLTFRNGDSVMHFSSDEPMTPEKRAKLKRAIEDMKQARKDADYEMKLSRKDLERIRKDAAKAASKAQASLKLSADDLERIREQARQDAEKARASFRWTREDQERVRQQVIEAQKARETALASWTDEDRQRVREQVREAQRAATEARVESRAARREALENELDAIDDAKSDLEETINENMEDALADLDDARNDLDDEDLTPDERAEALEAIAAARQSLKENGTVRREELRKARVRLDERSREIERELKRIEASENRES